MTGLKGLAVNNTEREMIASIYKCKNRLCTSYEVAVPNCFTSHDNEADLFFIRKSGFCDEVEIKVSRSDLLADSKKIVNYRECDYYGSGENKAIDEAFIKDNSNLNHSERKKLISPWQKRKHEALKDGNMKANYFWYAIKKGIGDITDIPKFCGLIIVHDDGFCQVIKMPDRLHRIKLTDAEKYQIARKSSYRYWKSEFGLGF